MQQCFLLMQRSSQFGGLVRADQPHGSYVPQAPHGSPGTKQVIALPNLVQNINHLAQWHSLWQGDSAVSVLQKCFQALPFQCYCLEPAQIRSSLRTLASHITTRLPARRHSNNAQIGTIIWVLRYLRRIWVRSAAKLPSTCFGKRGCSNFRKLTCGGLIGVVEGLLRWQATCAVEYASSVHRD